MVYVKQERFDHEWDKLVSLKYGTKTMETKQQCNARKKGKNGIVLRTLATLCKKGHKT